MKSTGRDRTAAALAVISGIVLALTVAVGYLQWAVGDSDQFADRAALALRDDSVRDEVAQRLTDEVILQRQADLLAARPLVESTVSSVVGGRAFGALFRAAVSDVHDAVFNRSENTVTLTVADAATLVSVALERVNPELARSIKQDRGITLDTWHTTLGGVEVAEALRGARIATIVLALLYLLLVPAALWLSADRRRTAIWLGASAAAAGLAVIGAGSAVRSAAVDDPSGVVGRDAAMAVWDAFFSDLRTLAWLVAGTGAVVAAAAASLIRPRSIGEPLRALGGLLAREPSTTWGKALRGVAVVVTGFVLILKTAAVVELLVTVFGIYLVYEGVMLLLSLIYSPDEAAARAAARAPVKRRSKWVLVAVAGLLVFSGGAAAVGTGALSVPGKPSGKCNGFAELCDRPFNEVALPATHNSMSVPLPGWFSAEQERPIPDQLRDGIRGLLIDTYFADRLPNGKHRTVFGKDPLEANGAEALPPEAREAALRIRDRLGFEGQGKRGMYLCHGFCELGATPVPEVLGQVREFLVANPEDVLLIINQDDVPPADFVAEVRSAGLEKYAYDGPVSGEWPTLREMIDSGQRLVIFSEHKGGAAPWYRVGYDEAMQETPFQFATAAQLTEPAKWPASCGPNRGPKTASLLLLNHWITNDPIPRPSTASVVNAYEPLLGRARACQKIRGMLPNILAVNFYRRGDVFGVANTLNGVGR